MSAIVPARAEAELWDFRLSGPTGGSGVSRVDVIVVTLEDVDGLTGTGFSYVLGGGGEVALAAARHLLDRHVAGASFTHPAALWRRLDAGLNRLGRGAGYIAIAAIDLAAWDLYAKRLAVPLGVAMGGAGRAVPVYGSGGFGPKQPPDEAAARALQYAAAGCTAVKLRLAGEAADFARIEAVAAALPDGVAIMADANEKCDLARAQWLVGGAAEYGLLWLEEPLPASDAAAYATLARTAPVPIALGEHLQGIHEFRPFLDAGSAAVAQPDLAMSGGITECLRIAQIAAYRGVATAPHFLPSLFVHLAAAAPSVTWLEDFPLLEPLFDGLAEMETDGTMGLPDAPGHGMNFADGARAEFLVKA